MSKTKRHIERLLESGMNLFGDDDWYESYQNHLYNQYGYDTTPHGNNFVVKDANGNVVKKTSSLEDAFATIDSLHNTGITYNVFEV